MKARSIVLVLFVIASLFLVSGCGLTGPREYYGEAIHTYTAPSTPKLEDVPKQFLVDDDTNYVLSFEDGVVAPGAYDLSGLNSFFTNKMCQIVTDAGYQCRDMNNNPAVTSAVVSRITGNAVASTNKFTGNSVVKLIDTGAPCDEETDGGDSPYVAGHVRYRSATVQSDYCSSLTTLEEYFCDGGTIKQKTYSAFPNTECRGDTFNARPLLRCWRNYERVRDDTVALVSCGDGWNFESLLGMIYITQVSDSIPIYACYRAIRTDRNPTGETKTYHDHFISTDANCEGASVDGFIGYVKTSAVSGVTVPITRCWQSADDLEHGRWNHYVASGTSCDTWQAEGTWHILNPCIDADGMSTATATTVQAMADSKTDTCADSTNVKEYYCDMGQPSGVSEKILACNQGDTCTDGACFSRYEFSINKTGRYDYLTRKLNYTVTVRNIGSATPNEQVLVAITDKLPLGVTVDTVVPAPTSSTGSELKWSLNRFDNDDNMRYSTASDTPAVYQSHGIFVINIVLTVDSNVAAGTVLVNYANVTIQGKVFEASNTVTVEGIPAPGVPCDEDTDGGDNPYVSGEIRKNYVAIARDSCVDSTTLREYSCVNNVMQEATHTAFPGTGCSNNVLEAAPLINCYRNPFNVGDNTVFVGSACPVDSSNPWRFTSLLGLIYVNQKPNTIPLYSCYRAHRTANYPGEYKGDQAFMDFFVSTDSNCEGSANTVEGILGYVYQTAIAGTTLPITRCWITPDDLEDGRYDHYISGGEGCGAGANAEGTWHILKSCIDPDGENALVSSTVRGVLNSKADVCVDSSVVEEAYCTTENSEGFATKRLTCSGGNTCSNGACGGAAQAGNAGIIVATEADNTFTDLNLVPNPVCPVGTSSIGTVYEFHGQSNTYGRKFSVCMNAPYQSGTIKSCSVESDSSEGPWKYSCDPDLCPAGTTSMSGLIKTGYYVRPGLNTYRYVNIYSRVCLPNVVGGTVLNARGDSIVQEVAPSMSCPVDTIEIAGLVSDPVYDARADKEMSLHVIEEFVYNKLCVATVNSCVNTIKDGTESDVDCGGSCTDKCAAGKACTQSSDCATNFCRTSTGICEAPPTGVTSYRISLPPLISPTSIGTGEFGSSDLVVVGTCSDNQWVAAALGTAGCTALTPGRALLWMTHNPYRLVIAAGDSTGVGVAINVLRNSAQQYNVHGQRMDITYNTAGSVTGITFSHCSDGTMNYGETGTDCGGPYCTACTTITAPTCSDNIQNQGETGVDCGGPCAACTSYPPATSGGTPSGSSGGGGRRGTPQPTAPQAGSAECYDDWICTAWTVCSNAGLQTRSCSLNDYPDCTLIIQKPSETQSCRPAVVSPPVAPVVENCFDGMQNQNEEGIDCGGVCAPCPGKASWLIPFIIVLVVIALVVGFLIYYDKFLKKPDVLSPLRKYVKDARGKSIPDARIKQILQNQGWSQSDIGKVMGK